jgi:hypothetical protein
VIGDLRMTVANSIRSLEERDRMRRQACDEFPTADDIENKLIPVSFGSSNSPAFRREAPQSRNDWLAR